jgi:hypothetical protein
MTPSMSAAAILVTTALRPSRPRRPRAALRSGSLDCLVRREISPACAQRAAMLISGGGFCFAQPPAVGKRSTAGGTELRFSSPVNASRPVNSQQTATSGNGSLQNVSKCSETFRNARMTYCLGHPAIVASNGPVGNHHPFCKSMQNSA